MKTKIQFQVIHDIMQEFREEALRVMTRMPSEMHKEGLDKARQNAAKQFEQYGIEVIVEA